MGSPVELTWDHGGQVSVRPPGAEASAAMASTVTFAHMETGTRKNISSSEVVYWVASCWQVKALHGES